MITLILANLHFVFQTLYPTVSKRVLCICVELSHLATGLIGVVLLFKDTSCLFWEHTVLEIFQLEGTPAHATRLGEAVDFGEGFCFNTTGHLSLGFRAQTFIFSSEERRTRFTRTKGHHSTRRYEVYEWLFMVLEDG